MIAEVAHVAIIARSIAHNVAGCDQAVLFVCCFCI